MSGGKKKQGQQGQKHQNKTAFKIQFNPLALEIHKKVSYRGLCKRCAGQITWKLQYNKYKRMTEPSRCALCQQKTVLRTYMTACEPCSESLKICPKCLDPESEQQVEVKLNAKEQKRHDEENERKMNQFLKTLKERSRRTVKRLYEKGTITWDAELNNFKDEEGNSLPLQFRQGYGGNTSNASNADDDEDIDEFGDEDEEGEDGEEEEEAGKQGKEKASSKPVKDKGGKGEKGEQEKQEEEQQGEAGQEEGEEAEGEGEEEQGVAEPKQQESKPNNQNQQDWEDVEDGQQEASDEEEEQEASEDSDKQKHTKKRKLSSHKHRHHK